MTFTRGRAAGMRFTVDLRGAGVQITLWVSRLSRDGGVVDAIAADLTAKLCRDQWRNDASECQSSSGRCRSKGPPTRTLASAPA
jgi:hypothetical protein